jgi:hypothetical protein
MSDKELTTLDAISPERKRLLDALSTGSYDTITELCEAADTSRQTYYAALQDKAFVDELFRNTSGTIYAAIPRIMDKIVRQAKSGSILHQKMLLEMVKLYQGGAETNVQVNNFVVVRGE